MNKSIEYFFNNPYKKSCEEYREHGQYHRLDGPAYTSWYVSGSIQSIAYMINGNYHREDGPAYQHFDRNGILLKEEYCFNGITYSKKEWGIRTRKNKLNKLNRCEEE